MKGRALCILLLSLITSTGVSGQGIFSYDLYQKYTQGVELNESGQYFSAYRVLLAAGDSLECQMKRAGKTSQTLKKGDFEVYYWPIKRSIAEVAYKLGLYQKMKDLATELTSALSAQDSASQRSHMMAEVAKIEAGHCFLTENFGSAEQLLNEALRLASPYEYEFINTLHEEKAQLYYRVQRYGDALSSLKAIEESPLYSSNWRISDKSVLKKKYSNLAQQALCLARMGKYMDARHYIDNVIKHLQGQRDDREYAEAIRKKGKILMLEYDSIGIYHPEARKCYNTYFELSKKYLNRHFGEMSEEEREQFWMAEHGFVSDCFLLENKDCELLYNTVLYSKALLLQLGRKLSPNAPMSERKKAISSLQRTWKDVKRNLPDSSAAIEFVVYEKRGEKCMGALVVRKESKRPKFIHISTLKKLAEKEVVRGWSVEKIIQTVGDEGLTRDLYEDDVLKKMIWTEELIESVKECSKIYFAPDGIFLQLGIEYMVPSELDGKVFYRLTTTRLLTERPRTVRDNGMVLVGGVDYKWESDEKRNTGNDALAYTLMSGAGVSLPSLSGSMEEVDSVRAVRGNVSDRLLCADSATEGILRELINKYHIVSISTHGYFDEAQKMGTEIRPSVADVQLSHSCLFLSGSERNLTNSEFDANVYDGVLSARELAGMDLSNVDLMVLSACMSGLGYVTPDGVYGLQRGLMTAGVGAVIVSLWMVDDAATSLFMKLFHTNLANGMGLRRAFDAAREMLRTTSFTKRYSSGALRTVSYDNPYFYNAFILIDGF